MGQHRTTTLELQLISAKSIKNEALFAKMDVYAVVSVDDGTHNVTQTKATSWVRKCGKNPTFNYTMRFTLDDSLLHNCLSSLQIQLWHRGPLLRKPVVKSEFRVPLMALFDSADPKDMKFVTSCQVWRVGTYFSQPKGELSFSYKFGDKFVDEVPAKKVQPVQSYPVQEPPSVQQQQFMVAAICVQPAIPWYFYV